MSLDTALSPPPLRLERGRQAAPQVFEWLRNAVIDLHLTPGTVLSRAQLAEQFGVSSTPVRDALMRLEEEALVDVFPQHATVVSPIDVKLAAQAHFLRRSIEIEVVRTVAAATSMALVARLGAILDRQEALCAMGDLDALTVEDQAFHRHLFEAADVPDLWHLVRSRSGHLDRLRRLHLPVPGKAEAVIRDHRAILDAIARGRPQMAQEAMRAHLSGTLANIDEIRTRFPGYLRG